MKANNSTAPFEHLGFIGLGNMGGAIALRLLRAGYPLTVLDLDADKLKPLLREGASSASTPREVGDRSTIVLASLQPADVEKVACGENGIVGIRIETDLRSHVDCDHPNRSKVRVRQGPQFSLLVMQRDRAILAVLLGCALRQSELECGANVLPSGGRKSPRVRPPDCTAGS